MKRLSISFLFIIFSLSFLAQASVPEGRAGFTQRSYNIVFIGNSITYGALHQQRELTAPPVQCARWFTQRDDIDSVYIANCGRSGRTTYHFLPNAADVIPAGDKTYFGDVVAKTRQLVKTHPGLPLVFSIMLGTNDTVERTKNRHTTPDAYVKNLTVIIDSLLRLWPDAHVVLNKPTWYYPDYHTKGGSVATKNSLKLITTYYEQFPKIVANSKPGHVHIGDAEAYGYFEKHYKTDVFEEKDARGQSYWLHPNEQGAAKLGEYWGKAILPVLKSATTAQMPQFQQEFGNPRKTFVETVAMPDHADSRYVVGQQATLRITAREGGVPLNGTTLYYKTAPEMFLPEAYDSTTFVNGEALVRMGTMTEPGFLACQYVFTVADGKKYGDLVKLAFSPEQIKSFTPMPKDFDKFWQTTLKEARKIPFEAEYRDIPSATNDRFVTRWVRLRVGKDKWMQGYLTIPLSSTEGNKGLPVVLCPPGAGSQKIYPSDYFPREGCVYMKIEIHDNDQLMPDEEYNRMRHEKCDDYMRRGMASKDTYYYKDVYVGCARAVDFLCSLPEWDGKNVIVTGGSQGGALTIITAALNEKVTVCAPFYPALCDLTGFLHQRAGGWPKFFSGFYKDGKIDIPNDQAVETLQYFDVVNFARTLKVPTFMSWGYNDDTCSPTSIWAAWNEITAPKACDITPSSGHWRFPSSWNKCWLWLKEYLR